MSERMSERKFKVGDPVRIKRISGESCNATVVDTGFSPSGRRYFLSVSHLPFRILRDESEIQPRDDADGDI